MSASTHTAKYKNLRLALIARRKTAGLTQSELANKLNRPQSYVSKYETGERRLDVIEFLDVAHAIGFDPTKLIQLLEQGKL